MAVTVSELFRDYESDFKSLQAAIDEKLQLLAENGGGDAAATAVEAGQKASEADQALRQMEVEARMMPTGQRSQLEPVLRQHRARLCEQRRALAEVKEAANRKNLLAGGSSGATVYGRHAEQERLTEAHQNMHSASARLEEAHRQALDAEAISMEVASDLRQQRDSIARARDNVGLIGRNYGMAKSMIESMQRRAEANRLLVRGIALFMLLVVAVAAYAMLGGGFGGGPGVASQGGASPTKGTKTGGSVGP